MRRRALDHVCASCRHCAQSRATLNRTSRRYVQISATPSSREPQQSLDAKEAGSGQTAGTGKDIADTTRRQEANTLQTRALRWWEIPSRSSRPRYHLHSICTRGKARCWASMASLKTCVPHILSHGEFSMLTWAPGSLYPFCPRAIPPSPLWHPLHLPAYLLHDSIYRSHRHQIAHQLARSGASRRQAGLDGSTAKFLISMDGAKLEPSTEGEHQDGRQDSQLISGRSSTDLLRA